jgi:hypothetical protein
MKKYANGGPSEADLAVAELAAKRVSKGKSATELTKELMARDIKKKMDALGPTPPAEIGSMAPGAGKSAEDQMMDQATDRGYEYTKRRPYKAGGSVSQRADGCAVRGKTRGKMV